MLDLVRLDTLQLKIGILIPWKFDNINLNCLKQRMDLNTGLSAKCRGSSVFVYTYYVLLMLLIDVEDDDRQQPYFGPLQRDCLAVATLATGCTYSVVCVCALECEFV